MKELEFFTEHLHGVPIILILRNLEPDETVRMTRRAWDLGVPLVEVPIASAQAMPSLLAAVEDAKGRGQIVGAGSIKSPEQVSLSKAAGAAFLVSPGFTLSVSEAARAASLPLLPGVASASEIMVALEHGHQWLKAFPASVLGVPWVRAQRDPFPEVRFVATGGVRADNASTFLAAGFAGLGVGGGGATAEALEQLVEAVNSYRNAPPSS